MVRQAMAAMLLTMDIFLAACDNMTMTSKEALGILAFSKRCLMPWIGIGYALCAASASKDAGMLLAIVARAGLFDDMQLQESEATYWRRALGLATQGLSGSE